MAITFVQTVAMVSMIVLLSGCGLTQKQKFESYTKSYQQANYCEAADIALGERNLCDKKVEEIDVKDYDIDEQLNAGTALFVAQKPEISNALFASAADSIQESLNSKGIARGTAEVMANASMVDYNPMIMDSIYLHSYAMMNALALKDKKEVKIQVNRAHSVQQNAVKEFSKEIEKQKKEAAKEAAKIEEAEVRAANDRNVSNVLSNYRELAHWKGYKDFVNPYMTYLSGLYFMTNGSGNSDYETASNYLKRVLGMTAGNPYVKEDLNLANKLANGHKNIIEPTAWIIFENGLISNFKELRLDIPVFLVTSEVKTVSVALPYPNEREAAYANIYVSNGKKKVETKLLADMDSVFISEFYKRLPTIIAKEVAKITWQTAAQVALRETTKDTNAALWGEIASYTVAAYSVFTAGADTRSWYSLPKNVQLAKIKKSGDALTFYIGAQELKVSVPKEGNSLIYVRVPAAGTIPTINVIDL